MSYAVMTYVYCDKCQARGEAVTSNKIKKADAWRNALGIGFVILEGRHLCGECASHCSTFEKLNFKTKIKGVSNDKDQQTKPSK